MSDGEVALQLLAAMAQNSKGRFHHIIGPTHEGLQGEHLYVNGRVELTPEQSALVKKLKEA